MGNSPAESTSYQGTEKSDPAHMAFLIGQIGRLDFQVPKQGYPRPATRPQRKAHIMSASELQSFEFLKTYNHDFSAGFSEAELKKAFRHCAIVLHPDQGGSTELFMDLKAHYEILKAVLARKA